MSAIPLPISPAGDDGQHEAAPTLSIHHEDSPLALSDFFERVTSAAFAALRARFDRAFEVLTLSLGRAGTVEDLTTEAIARVKGAMLAVRRDLPAVNRTLEDLAAFGRLAHAAGLIAELPTAERLEGLCATPRQPDEFEQLLSACKAPIAATHLAALVATPNRSGLSSRMTLSQFFKRFYLPVILEGGQVTEKTKIGIRQSVKEWAAISGDPPLNDIDEYTTANFLAKLSNQPKRTTAKYRRPQTMPAISSHTVKRHVATLNAILQYTGPRSGRGKLRKAQSLLPEAPYIDRPHVEKHPPKPDFKLDEIERILATADRMVDRRLAHWEIPAAAVGQRPRRSYRSTGTVRNFPHGFPPEISIGAFWRALVTFLFYTGLRINSAMHAEYAHLDGNYLTVPARTAKGRKGQRKYLHPLALAAIQSIRTDRRYIFPWPNYHVAGSSAQRWLFQRWKQLLSAAGLPPARRFGFHGLRRASATALAGINPLAATLSCNHSDSRTTLEHYINPGIERDAIQKMPRLGEQLAGDRDDAAQDKPESEA